MCKVVKMKIGDRTIRVADIKKKYIENIVDAARECDYIDRVVLFGSSIESRCKEDSDIDLAVFGNVCMSRCLRSKKYLNFVSSLSEFDNFLQSYDILYFRTGVRDKSPILNDISEGEVIYVRD